MKQEDYHTENLGNGNCHNGQAKTILLAHGQEIVRVGLRMVFEQRVPWLRVLGEAENLPETLQRAQQLHPDMVVIDADLPPSGSLEAIRQLKAAAINKVLVLAHSADILLCCEAIEAGASGFVLKSSMVDELSSALQAVAANQVFISSVLTDLARTAISCCTVNCQTSSNHHLTAREHEVLQLLSDGRSTKEMAQALAISGRTVETHRVQIMNKLDIHSTAGLTKYAIRHGLTRL